MFRKIVPFVFSMIFGGLIGISTVWLIFQANVKGPMLVVYVLLVIVFYGCHIVIHEAGHAIFGLMTGYKLISFRVFNLMCVKDEQTNKILFKKHHVPGTLGQCLMAPPNYVDGQFPLQLYLLGGVMVDGIVSLVAILFYKHSVALGLFGIVGILEVVSNIVPDGFNDGMTLKLVRKSHQNQYLIYVQLQLTYLWNKGISLAAMPDNLFKVEQTNKCESYLDQFYDLLIAERSWELENWDTMKETLELLWSIKEKLILPYQSEVRRLLLIYLCLNSPKDIRVKELWESKEMIQLRKMKNFDSSIIKANYYYFVENNRDDATIELKQAISRLEQAIYPGIKQDQTLQISIIEKKMKDAENHNESSGKEHFCINV